MSIMSFSDLNRLFKNGDNMFTHTWGMKQQMRDNAFFKSRFFADDVLNELSKIIPK